ncbi:hypothetical protein OFN64_29665, partial [Escherichia coli]|nr:hypothetical protein [Escherichia coli]
QFWDITDAAVKHCGAFNKADVVGNEFWFERYVLFLKMPKVVDIAIWPTKTNALMIAQLF